MAVKIDRSDLHVLALFAIYRCGQFIGRLDLFVPRHRALWQQYPVLVSSLETPLSVSQNQYRGHSSDPHSSDLRSFAGFKRHGYLLKTSF